MKESMATGRLPCGRMGRIPFLLKFVLLAHLVWRPQAGARTETSQGPQVVQTPSMQESRRSEACWVGLRLRGGQEGGAGWSLLERYDRASRVQPEEGSGIVEARGGEQHVDAAVRQKHEEGKGERVSPGDQPTILKARGYAGIRLEHAIARRRVMKMRSSNASRLMESPYLPLFLCKGGRDAVIQMQRRRLWRLGLQNPERLGEDEGPLLETEQLFEPDNLIRLQVNDWKPHLDVGEKEQTLFIDKMLREQTAAGRLKLLVESSGKLGEKTIEQWRRHLSIISQKIRALQEHCAACDSEEVDREAGCTLKQVETCSLNRFEDEIMAAINNIDDVCSALYDFKEEVEKEEMGVPVECTQRYLYLDMAIMGWEFIFSSLQEDSQDCIFDGSLLPEGFPSNGSIVEPASVSSPIIYNFRLNHSVVPLNRSSKLIMGNDSNFQLCAFESEETVLDFAFLHSTLGDCYFERVLGPPYARVFTRDDRQQNLRRAMKHYDNARQLFLMQNPLHWARCNIGIAQCLLHLPFPYILLRIEREADVGKMRLDVGGNRKGDRARNLLLAFCLLHEASVLLEPLRTKLSVLKDWAQRHTSTVS
ncbi:hypothetical protein GUITHDRAFT_133580 [Guillardia theta CCMP2712]|uniref:Uncharacterized protein n=1 Tax=Guillardia theta (strain CCMP2712) TaxID=905079 RepID=L1JWM4_GUITC|nr:hypothetical protein GUITHDRAFT_133580 [Guillardia theta CCMP2712]EKX52498.1 hypothetical protein GUITHDRAFT_133580 [Guillardia theta CCMP2712]|eukprot:XP_005839478.1 hypothetical protein GUITHDRAFT_133580 [Guillardia theta CCMP2712]